MMSRKWAVRVIAAIMAVIMIMGIAVVSLRAFAVEINPLMVAETGDSILYKILAAVFVVALVYICSQVALYIYNKKFKPKQEEDKLNVSESENKPEINAEKADVEVKAENETEIAEAVTEAEVEVKAETEVEAETETEVQAEETTENSTEETEN
ncbi:MAG: hypothetical protein K5917_03350 [Clostridiales bacterium]|nr:hypothetical protein [Clostridiales bacterium]